METQKFLPLIGDEHTDRNTIYKGENVIATGDFNSVIYNGKYRQKDVHIRRIPGVRKASASITQEILKVTGLPTHANLLQYLHADIIDHNLVVVTLVTETNLEAYVRDGNYPISKIDLMKQAATGLEFLHNHHIVHGNLKPANILIFPRTQMVKLANFGFNSVVSELMQCLVNNGVYIEAVDWMPTEILTMLEIKQALTIESKKVDMFSLGCIFYYTLAEGKHPFGDVVVRFHNIINDHPKLSDSVVSTDHAALPVISLLISRSPSKRPSSDVLAGHVIFMSTEMKMRFLESVCNLYIYPSVQNRLKLLDTALAAFHLSSWWENLEKVLIRYLKTEKKMQIHSLYELIQAFVLVYNEFDVFPTEIATIFTHSKENVVTDFESKFPFLFEILWISMQKLKYKYSQLKDFYIRMRYPISEIILRKYSDLRTIISSVDVDVHSPSMEWQKDYIHDNLDILIQSTCCTPYLLNTLHYRGILTAPEKDEIENLNDKNEQVTRLYQIALTKEEGYFMLCKVLYQDKQFDASKKLNEGFLQQNIHYDFR